ncbi:hypothetical protein EV356DRAFT_528914 [Viridothelium virens]|uniref:Small secreted protein n=1 Tax=Viridothelium virens TaxID=1048519 RepID=A0A6A6HNB5_VIRVR|nr:hypothetical protein EV356DRAFT_528914 [Viridothelium virens]
MLFIFLASFLGLSSSFAAAANSNFLTATAIVTDKSNNSAFECWEFTTPFSVSTDAGTTGAATLPFNTSEIVYTVIPPRFNGGTHKAPKLQLVAFLTGLAHVTLPTNSSSEAWILGGSATSLIVAADTTGGGHITTYPSDETTLSLQIPLDGDTPLPYNVISNEACHQTTQIVGGSS